MPIELSWVDFSRITEAQLKARKSSGHGDMPETASAGKFDPIKNAKEDISLLEEVISTPASALGRTVKEKLRQDLVKKRARLVELQKEKKAKVTEPVLLRGRANALAG